MELKYSTAAFEQVLCLMRMIFWEKKNQRGSSQHQQGTGGIGCLETEAVTCNTNDQHTERIGQKA